MITASDYLTMFDSATLTKDEKKIKVLESVITTAFVNQDIYQSVSKMVSIPWPVIAALHYRESDQRFNCHLHNGDSLLARTVHVPKGRPFDGEPPFTWIESAVDVLGNRHLPEFWSLAGCLEFMEGYNGFGYRNHGLNTPYLWDFTDKYTSGLYVSDGSIDLTKVENRAGCVAIFKALADKGVSFDFSHILASGSGLH